MTFRRILLKAAAKKRKAYEALLEQVPMLKEITVSCPWSCNAKRNSFPTLRA